MTIAANPPGASDIRPGRLDSADSQRQFRRPASPADLPRGEGRGRALLFLLRRPLPAGLPDRDRHSPVHPPDRRGQPRRCGDDHSRRQHHGRHLRPGLPDRDAVRGGVRAGGGRRQAGRHRPIAALCDRSADRDRHNRPISEERRPANGSRSSAPVRRASPARMSLRWPASSRRSSKPREKPGGLNEYGIAAYKMVDDFAAKEAAFILSIGGIEVKSRTWRLAAT